jgi:uncharacterized protein YndB with AHSA1/START domain
LTKPELVKRWFGPRGWSVTTREIDLKPGGKWRTVISGPGGRTQGVGRLVEEGGKTALTVSAMCSKEIRGEVIKGGMEPRVAETYDPACRDRG